MRCKTKQNKESVRQEKHHTDLLLLWTAAQQQEKKCIPDANHDLFTLLSNHNFFKIHLFYYKKVDPILNHAPQKTRIHSTVKTDE
jgi:hypothetical protein